MPRQQTVKQQAQEVVDQASASAAAVADQAREKAKDLQEAAANASSNIQDAVNSAKTTAQSYAQEGQRIASEQTANVQDAAKRAYGTAQGYVDDACKKADQYVESAKAKVESAKAAAGNARESAQHVVDSAKEQMNAVRERVSEKAQPYVQNVQDFDITTTAPFHVFTHLISVLLYVVWRILQFVPPAQHVVQVIQEKEKNAGVVSSCASAAEKVPLVGPRTVEVAMVACKSVRTDLNEQIAQYESNSKKKK